MKKKLKGVEFDEKGGAINTPPRFRWRSRLRRVEYPGSRRRLPTWQIHGGRQS